MTMNYWKFEKDGDEITIEANNYTEALNALIFKVGSEEEASEYMFAAHRMIGKKITK